MKWKNLVKIAFKSLFKNKTRSLLTSLGIIIGVSAVIVMVAIGEGSQQKIQSHISALGANLIMVLPGSENSRGVHQGQGSMNRLTLADVDDLTAAAALCSAFSPYVSVRQQVVGNGTNWNTTIAGVSIDYLAIRELDIEEGEYFTEKDIKSKRKVAVIGQTVAENLFDDADPIGQKIRIGNTPFKVIGVLSEKGETGMGQDQDDIVLAPATTVLYRLKGGQYINMIYASARSMEQSEAAQAEIKSILRAAHKLAEGEDDDFHIRSQAEIMAMVESTTQTMTMLLGSIAAVSLLVGGIGIMNIMLVSVTERTREIGIRLSIGARGRDILLQFLLEAVVLSVVGGLIGVLLAFSATLTTSQFGISAVIQPAIVLLAVGFAALVGVFFGFYPARRAANLNPIDALRYE